MSSARDNPFTRFDPKVRAAAICRSACGGACGPCVHMPGGGRLPMARLGVGQATGDLAVKAAVARALGVRPGVLAGDDLVLRPDGGLTLRRR